MVLTKPDAQRLAREKFNAKTLVTNNFSHESSLFDAKYDAFVISTWQIDCVNGPLFNEAVEVEAEQGESGAHPVDHDQRRFNVLHHVRRTKPARPYLAVLQGRRR